MDRPCIACLTRPSTRRGEHVEPQWEHGLRDELEQAPTPWTRSGHAILDRHGNPVRLDHRARTLIDMCEPCNAELERRFERSAREPISRLIRSRGFGTIARTDVGPVALWQLKRLLLLSHPRVRYSYERISDAAVRWSIDEQPDQSFYAWMTDGSMPPPDVSLWLTRTSHAMEPAAEPTHRMYLPRHLRLGAETLTSAAFVVARDGLCLTLVVHPGLRIDHPLEATGDAVRLWPDPPGQDIDLDALPPLPYNVIGWYGGGLAVTAEPGHERVISPSRNGIQGLLSMGGIQGIRATSAS